MAIEAAVAKIGGSLRGIAVLVAGASGFAGALAAELIRRHPSLELARVTARTDAGRRLDELYPRYRVRLVLEEPAADDGADVDAAIVAYPHGAAAPDRRGPARAGHEGGRPLRRLPPARPRRPTSTGTASTARRELLGEAVYGLTELHREAIAGAGLVANPGCYPTASVLALAPLASEGLIEDVVIDAKSGVSGAGRAAAEEMALRQGIGRERGPTGSTGHRHTPEIEQELAELAGTDTIGLLLTEHPRICPSPSCPT